MESYVCNLCFKAVTDTKERFLINGKGSFNISLELRSLSIERKSEYICRPCFRKLKKRRQLIEELKILEDLFRSKTSDQTRETSPLKRQYSSNHSAANNELKATPTKRSREDLPSQSTPKNKARTPQCDLSPLRVVNQNSDVEKITKNVGVKVRVTWPCKEQEIKLPEDLESLGKMLVRGTYKQIANAAWRVSNLKSELVNLFLKEVEKETSSLCSRKDPSCLRKTDRKSLQNLTMEEVSKEVKTKAPLFHGVLTTSCSNSRTVARGKGDHKDYSPAVAMAAAVCLKSRCRNMIAVQLLITTFLYHSNWLTTLARLKALCIGTSHTYFYNKLDEFGKDHTQTIIQAVVKEGKYMEVKMKAAGENNASADVELQHPESSIPDAGRKLTFDNIDYHQQVHYMTEEHQDNDKHCVTIMSTENRVSGNHLSDEKPSDGILDMENAKCIPDHRDSIKQRENYHALVGRLITKHLPCLEFMSKVATHHIPHQYKREMSTKTNTTFIGMINESENDADGILTIIRALQEYVPFYGEEEERVYGDQGIVGDQLSVERGVNGHMSLANGFTPEQRADGIHFEVADWHAGNKFLEVAFSRFFSSASSADKCTMYSDRNLVNRRNVKGDVSGAANACRRFFQIEVETRVVAAAMKFLGMTKLDDTPSAVGFPSKTSSIAVLKAYLNKIASFVVDTFVVDQERNQIIEKSVQKFEQQSRERPNADGKYPCRFLGCSKAFAHAGKRRKDHEAQHNPPLVIDDAASTDVFSKPSKGDDDDKNRDDMWSYQKALLDYGMLILNFFDGISEGDGERVYRCWKYFLMYLKHHGASDKYALEALYLLFQANALLSPRSAHRLIWDRFVKNKQEPGGNIPLDLQLEFYNKSVKEAIKKLGPNASVKSINRICHCIGFTTELLKGFDDNLSVFKRSGRHVRTSTSGDFQKIVNELIQNDAFEHTPGREYRCFARMKTSILEGFNMRKMYSWINAHKKYMILNRRAR